MTDTVEEEVTITIGGENKPLEPTAAETAAAEKATADAAAAKVAADTAEAAKEADKAKEYDPAVWGDTGSDVGNSVIQVLSESGVTPEEAKALVYDAAKAGDPSKIDRAALEAKVGKAAANIIISGVNSLINEDKQKADAIAASVAEAAGGKDAWDLIKVWALKNVSEEDLNEYRGMIDAGGKQATLAAKALKEAYNGDAKNEKLGKRVVEGGVKNAPKAEAGLTKRAYGDKLSLLQRQGKATPEARAALYAQRKAGIAQGL